MGASLALAGVHGLHAPAGREDRSLRPAARGAHPRQAAVLRHGDDARRRRHRPARREPRGAADQDRGQSRAPGQPRRDRRLRAGGDPRSLRSRSRARRDQPRRDPPVAGVPRHDARRRSSAQEPLQRRRAAHPHRDGHLADARRPDPGAPRALSRGASGTSGIPRRATRPRRAPSWPSARCVDAHYHFDQADVILSLDADFLGVAAPASLRYARAVRRAPPARRRRSDEPALRASRRMPTPTGSRADHRLPLKPSEIETRRARSSPPPSASPARPAARRVAGRSAAGASAAWPPSPRICSRTGARASSSPATRSRRPCTRSRTR